MAYIHMLSDLGMNYTLNRALNDGTANARIEETKALAPQIKDFDSWSSSWLAAAKLTKISDGRMLPRTTTTLNSIFLLVTYGTASTTILRVRTLSR